MRNKRDRGEKRRKLAKNSETKRGQVQQNGPSPPLKHATCTKLTQHTHSPHNPSPHTAYYQALPTQHSPHMPLPTPQTYLLPTPHTTSLQKTHKPTPHIKTTPHTKLRRFYQYFLRHFFLQRQKISVH